MTSIAFYAPMKSPEHPTPSGDRTVARSLVQALGGLGQVDLVSELRLRDGVGDTEVQQRLTDFAQAEAARLIAKGGWDIWVTYHNYYKAPDLIGPAVSQALGIPYVLIESTRALKRFGGRWDQFARAAEIASDAADVIFYFTQQDGQALLARAPAGQQVVKLNPFLMRAELGTMAVPTGPVILAAGMMRQGDKFASYQAIARTLPFLQTSGWQLHIAGDGPARPEIETLFAPMKDHVTYLGQLDAEGMARAYHNASLFLWPGVNEAFGMVYLEAQAAGLPVIAEYRPGIEDVLPPEAMVAVGRPEAVAGRIDLLLRDRERREEASLAARTLVKSRHLLPSGQATLRQSLEPLLKGNT